jgi:hypothetical protein
MVLKRKKLNELNMINLFIHFIINVFLYILDPYIRLEKVHILHSIIIKCSVSKIITIRVIVFFIFKKKKSRSKKCFCII